LQKQLGEMLRTLAYLSIVLFHAAHMEVGKVHQGEDMSSFIMLTLSGLIGFGRLHLCPFMR